MAASRHDATLTSANPATTPADATLLSSLPPLHQSKELARPPSRQAAIRASLRPAAQHAGTCTLNATRRDSEPARTARQLSGQHRRLCQGSLGGLREVVHGSPFERYHLLLDC
jgi:hypothetical protein